jgi:hypothetical protein
MFCPRCGQQAAEEVSFCSRCGLPLDAAAEVVEAGGALARREAGAPLTPRQKGVRKGLMITIGGLLFFVLVAILTTIKEDFFPFLILAGLVLVVGIMRVLYGLLLEDHKPNKKTSKRAAAADAGPELGRGSARGGELPPARAVPASLYTKPAADTSDMAASPLSVTEGTTRLLDEDEGAPARRAGQNTSG